ncbi:MAG: hypothetical protein ACOX4U_06210 [Anaerovoracaceae bacterium]
MKGGKIIVSFLLVLALFAFVACGTGTSGYNRITPNNVEAPGNVDGNRNNFEPGSSSPGNFNNTNDADRNVVRDGTRNILDNNKDNTDNTITP